jgi:hypothetical protein
VERLNETRGPTSRFFAFADTVSAKSFRGNNECHGWMGIRFQTKPNTAPNEIILHVRMWDQENVMQQQAIGVFGTNLIYGAFFYNNDVDQFINSLIDQLSVERIEVDMIELSGPDFQNVDNRLMSLKLVEKHLTNAVMFGAEGKVLQPSEVLRKRPVLLERGSFRPVTHVNIDMLESAKKQFIKDVQLTMTEDSKEPMYIMEITMNNLLALGELDHQDFLSRVDTLRALGYNVMISNYPEYFRLVSYFRRYTKEMVAMVLGINALLEIFNEKYYEVLEGGILESFGRMFRNQVRLYVYPMTQSAFQHYRSAGVHLPENKDIKEGDLITADNLFVAERLKYLYQHLRSIGCIIALTDFHPEHFNIFSRDILKKIREGDPSWEAMLPEPVTKMIKERALFGYRADAITH